MPGPQPDTKLDTRFSSSDATVASWDDARDDLSRAEIYWVTTVRTDGRPHVTPLIGVWVDDALHFCTGETEQKARNLEANANCILTTGCNAYGEGRDVVVEGLAERVTDHATLQRIADAYLEKYGEDWRFEVRDGGFFAGHDVAWVFGVAPVTAFGYGRGDTFSQTRWRF